MYDSVMLFHLGITHFSALPGVDTGGFSKDLDNFSFWWVLDAGHMVPTDQGEFMLYLLHDTVTKTV